MLEEGQFKVVAELDKEGNCPVLDFLEGLNSSFSGSASGIIDLFELYAESGQSKLSSSQFHSADENGVYRFSKGKLRIYCFKDGTDLVICSHGALKKGQKTAIKDSRAAQSCKTRYADALKKGEVEFVSMEDYQNE